MRRQPWVPDALGSARRRGSMCPPHVCRGSPKASKHTSALCSRLD